jgi:hypothetical protein
MDPQIPQKQSPISQPTPSAELPIAPHEAPLKNQRVLWICAGIFVLLIGIGIGIVFMHPTQKSNTQSVNQNTVPQTNASMAPVASGNISSYPTVSQSLLPLGDNKYTTTGPKKGYVYLCRVMKGNGGAQESGSWISGTTWTMQTSSGRIGKLAKRYF